MSSDSTSALDEAEDANIYISSEFSSSSFLEVAIGAIRAFQFEKASTTFR